MKEFPGMVIAGELKQGGKGAGPADPTRGSGMERLGGGGCLRPVRSRAQRSHQIKGSRTVHVLTM